VSEQPVQPDLSEFFKYSKPKKPPCKIGYALSQLKPQERSQLTAALATDRGLITAAAIVEWAAKRGHEISPSAINSHTRKTCSCEQD
jgi:hypothetical protein